MPKNPYTLGTENASKQLLRDLYIDLRAKANFWSALTKQTPQARHGVYRPASGKRRHRLPRRHAPVPEAET